MGLEMGTRWATPGRATGLLVLLLRCFELVEPSGKPGSLDAAALGFCLLRGRSVVIALLSVSLEQTSREVWPRRAAGRAMWCEGALYLEEPQPFPRDCSASCSSTVP